MHSQSVSTSEEPINANPIDNDKPTLPILAGLAGAAMTVAVVATMKRSGPQKDRAVPISSEERAVLRRIVALGEEKGWNLSYDEHFIFELWPALKAMAK